MAEDNIKVVVVDDDGEIRQLLTVIIDGSPGFSCKQSYNDCESAIEGILTEPPNVVLMDINLPGKSGIEGVSILKEKLPDTDFIMLTVKDDDESVFDSICAGATGYLLKDTPPAVLLESIREVYHGGSPMSSAIARRIVSSFKKNSDSPLSGRETEILQKMCDGYNYRDIAEKLFISNDTVRAHIKNIYRKLHVHSRAEVVKKAIEDNLI
jgi:DNA-binding NarL/FixJ family response regulator